MNKSSNITNKTALYDHLFAALMTLDIMVRYYSVIIHLVYVLIFIASKQLHRKTYLYTIHATIVNCFYSLMIFFYLFGDHPNTGNTSLDDIFCSLSEIVWPFSSYIRVNSILLIALYRFIAVFKISFYKKINDSFFILVSPVIFIWAISFIIPISLKYSLQTKGSFVFCLDGYTTVVTNSALYFIFNSIFLIIIPTFVVIRIYLIIHFKLKSLSSRVGPQYESSAGERTSNNEQTSQMNSQVSVIKLESIKQHRFANQFILMCASVVFSNMVLLIFGLRGIIYNFFVVFYYWRPVLRVFINGAISIVPVISLWYHPSRVRVKNLVVNSFKRIA